MSDLHARTVEAFRDCIHRVRWLLHGSENVQPGSGAWDDITAELEKWDSVIAEHEAAAPISKSQAKRFAALEAAQSEIGIPISEQNQSVAQTLLGPIERDEGFDRTYIPLPGGWEVQTKGRGSSFRIADTKNKRRLLIPDEPYVHEWLEKMAREIHEACTASAPASQLATPANLFTDPMLATEPVVQYIGKDDVWTSPGRSARQPDSKVKQADSLVNDIDAGDGAHAAAKYNYLKENYYGAEFLEDGRSLIQFELPPDSPVSKDLDATILAAMLLDGVAIDAAAKSAEG